MESVFNKSKKILAMLLILFMLSTYTTQIFAAYTDSIKVGDTLKFTGSAWTVYKTESGAKNLKSSDVKRYLSQNNKITIKYKNGNVLKIGTGEYIYYGSTASKYFSKVSNNSTNNSTQNSISSTTSSNSSTSSKRTSIFNLLLNLVAKSSYSKNSSSISSTNNNVTIPDYIGPGYKFYYNNLNNKQKSLYQYIYSKKSDLINANTINLTPLINKLGGISSNDVFKAIGAMKLDHPEYYYILSCNSYYLSGNSFTLKIKFNKKDSNLASKLRSIDSTVNNLINNVKNKSDYEKLKYLHDWICTNMTYKTNSSLSIDGFTSKTGQCMTYAMMYKYLLNKLNIDCIYVSGKVPSGGAHAWNYVELNNKWYGVDVCWDDPSNKNTVIYTYFLKGKNTFSDRTLNYSYPSLNSKNY